MDDQIPARTPTQTEDLVAIRHTLSAYNVAGDRMRIEALAATFREDGVLETPTATLRGRKEIVAGLGDRGRDPAAPPPTVPRPTVVRHHLTTSHVTLTGADTAEARTYFIVFTDIGPDHSGHYQDRLIRTDGVWLFAHRSVRVDWIAEASLFPGLKAAGAARRAGAQAVRNP